MSIVNECIISRIQNIIEQLFSSDNFWVVVTSIVTSIIAAIIFWIVFDYIPKKKRYNKIRPLVDNYIYWTQFYLWAFLSRAFYYNEGTCINNQRQFNAGLLQEEDFYIALQNKCLNDTYKFDENRNEFMSIGDSLKSNIEEINKKIRKLMPFIEFMSSEEIMLLENISYRLGRQNFDYKVNLQSPPVVPNMSQGYVTYMFKLYELYLNLRRKVVQFKTINIFDDVDENQISVQRRIDLYYSGQYKKCTKSVNENEENLSLLWCKCLSEYQLSHKEKAYILLEKILLNNKEKLVGAREWVKPLLNDEKAISVILKYESKDEINWCIKALKNDDNIDSLFYERNNRLKKSYEEKRK